MFKVQPIHKSLSLSNTVSNNTRRSPNRSASPVPLNLRPSGEIKQYKYYNPQPYVSDYAHVTKLTTNDRFRVSD